MKGYSHGGKKMRGKGRKMSGGGGRRGRSGSALKGGNRQLSSKKSGHMVYKHKH